MTEHPNSPLTRYELKARERPAIRAEMCSSQCVIARPATGNTVSKLVFITSHRWKRRNRELKFLINIHIVFGIDTFFTLKILKNIFRVFYCLPIYSSSILFYRFSFSFLVSRQRRRREFSCVVKEFISHVMHNSTRRG